MRVVLTEALFDDSYPDHLGLVSLIRLAQDGRHQVLLRPSFDIDDTTGLPRTRWLEQQHHSIRQQLAALLTTSARDASSGSPDAVTVTVIAEGRSNWDTLELALPDSRELLTSPLKVRLENHAADWAFVRALAPAHQRRELDEAKDRGWLEVLGLGGIDEMWKILRAWEPDVRADPSAHAVDRRGTWVMFDRDTDIDANEPLSPSPRHTSLRELCTVLGIRHQPLHRRTIENYLPLKSFEGECPDPGSFRLAQLDALLELRDNHPCEAFSLSIKEGILKDSALTKPQRHEFSVNWRAALSTRARIALCRPIDALLPPVWRTLPDELRANLLWGFGKKCAARFGQCDIMPEWESWFQSEYDRGPEGQPNREAFISSLLEAI